MNLPGFTAEASLTGRGEKFLFYAHESIDVLETLSANPQITLQSGLPVYGNWCGPGHGGGPAIDAVDAVCRTHDACYNNNGYKHCGCDRALILRMPGAISHTSSSAGKAAGAAAAAFFVATPCVCYINTPYPCGVKMCTKWGVPYPCGVKTCWQKIPVTGGVGGVGPC